LAGVIELAIESRLKEVHTCIPCIVESFDKDTQTVSAQPTIKRIYKDIETGVETSENLPLLINVPVSFPSGGGFHLTFPVKKGDECLIHFAERSIDNWHDTGKVQSQSNRRFHDLSDGIAVVGIASLPNKITNFSDDTQLRNSDGTVSISITTDSKIKLLGDVEITGKISVTDTASFDGGLESIGTHTNNGINVGSTHFHTQGNDSLGGVQVPTNPPT